MWLSAKLRYAKQGFFMALALCFHKPQIRKVVYSAEIGLSFDFLSFVGSSLTCWLVSYCLLGQALHIWWFHSWMERPSNMIHLLCNISDGIFRHFIFRNEEAWRHFIFRNEEARRHFIFRNEGPRHFIFRNEEARRRHFIFRNEEARRHFIFWNEEPRRHFIFRREETCFSDLWSSGHFILWAEEAVQFLFFNDLSSLDWKLQSAMRRACFPSFHLVAYNWVLSVSFSCLS